jgi:hypothetical protein
MAAQYESSRPGRDTHPCNHKIAILLRRFHKNDEPLYSDKRDIDLLEEILKTRIVAGRIVDTIVNGIRLMPFLAFDMFDPDEYVASISTERRKSYGITFGVVSSARLFLPHSSKIFKKWYKLMQYVAAAIENRGVDGVGAEIRMKEHLRTQYSDRSISPFFVRSHL